MHQQTAVLRFVQEQFSTSALFVLSGGQVQSDRYRLPIVKAPSDKEIVHITRVNAPALDPTDEGGQAQACSLLYPFKKQSVLASLRLYKSLYGTIMQSCALSLYQR
ncbi:hypothetical protein SAMN05421881_10624 [Nitrosomonas halophila]|uniref:Uncharacterized protein n=1 Tax=Nitrosomonas halophila TaxID=44576 RepID=A0A1H3MM50_9PROT|nr:hypothetical protein SAMN05421881_10624 [Nitrosomonas halophila]